MALGRMRAIDTARWNARRTAWHCGARSVGLYAAYYAGFRTLRTKIVERLAALGGQITALYPEKWIYDVAGFPRILGRDLIDNLVAQARQ